MRTVSGQNSSQGWVGVPILVYQCCQAGSLGDAGGGITFEGGGRTLMLAFRQEGSVLWHARAPHFKKLLWPLRKRIEATGHP